MNGRRVFTLAAMVALVTTSFQEAIAGPYFIVPFDSQMLLSAAGGEASASTEFGLLAADNTQIPLFRGLPNNPSPIGEVSGGLFSAGTDLNFYMITQFGGDFLATSNGVGNSRAFMDLDNSLGLGGRTVEQTSQNTWLLHLDDAASGDDDDNDVLIRIRLYFVPEPSGFVLLSLGLMGVGALVRRARMRRDGDRSG